VRQSFYIDFRERCLFISSHESAGKVARNDPARAIRVLGRGPWLELILPQCTHQKVYIKAQNFRNTQNRVAYAYILAPLRITLRKVNTIAFLLRTKAVRGLLQQEIKAPEKKIAYWRS